MVNLRQPVLVFTASAIILLGAAQFAVGLSGTNSTATAPVTPVTAIAQSNATAHAHGAAAEPETEPSFGENPILDAAMLSSPVSYLRAAFAPEDEDMGAPARPGTAVMALKALTAALLSTII